MQGNNNSNESKYQMFSTQQGLNNNNNNAVSFQKPQQQSSLNLGVDSNNLNNDFNINDFNTMQQMFATNSLNTMTGKSAQGTKVNANSNISALNSFDWGDSSNTQSQPQPQQ